MRMMKMTAYLLCSIIVLIAATSCQSILCAGQLCKDSIVPPPLSPAKENASGTAAVDDDPWQAVVDNNPSPWTGIAGIDLFETKYRSLFIILLLLPDRSLGSAI
jgi:hypothetical protein